MSYSANSSAYYPSSKDSRYTSSSTPLTVVAPSSSYGGYSSQRPYAHTSTGSTYNSASHYGSSNVGTASGYPNYSSGSYVPTGLPSGHHSQTAYPNQNHPHGQSYDTSGYSNAYASVPGATRPSLTNASYAASPARAFQCERCALSFDRSHDLKRHRDSHSGARPFICHSCTRSFTRKDALKRHQSQKQCGIEDA